jgi:hypothetical protein
MTEQCATGRRRGVTLPRLLEHDPDRPVGQGGSQKQAATRAVAGGTDGHFDRLAHGQGVMVPAAAAEVIRAHALERPDGFGSVLAGGSDGRLRVRIGPDEAEHRACEPQLARRIEFRR